MKIIVCGGRDFTDSAYAFRAFDGLLKKFGKFDVIEGGQRTRDKDTGEIIGGADYWANVWGRKNGLEVRTYRADWKKFGDSAGPIRNTEMLNREKPDLVAYLRGGAGTNNMISQARKRGVKVIAL